jgi:hypothetical protein
MLIYSPASSAKVTEARIAVSVAKRRRGRLAPRAVELAATCLFRFHRTIKGSLSPSLKSRPQSIARRIGHGIRGLMVDDIAELVTNEGPHKAIARAAVRELLAPILHQLEDQASNGVVLGEAVADFAESSARVGDAFMRGGDHARLLDELGRAEVRARTLRRLLHHLRTTNR